MPSKLFLTRRFVAVVLWASLQTISSTVSIANGNRNGEEIEVATWDRGLSRRSGWEWMGRDAFDEFIEEFDAVRADNCHDHRGARMPTDTLSQTLAYNNILTVRSCTVANTASLSSCTLFILQRWTQDGETGRE